MGLRERVRYSIWMYYMWNFGDFGDGGECMYSILTRNFLYS